MTQYNDYDGCRWQGKEGGPKSCSKPGMMNPTKMIEDPSRVFYTVSFYTFSESNCGKALPPKYVDFNVNKSMRVYIKMPLPGISEKYLNTLTNPCIDNNECYLIEYAMQANKQNNICQDFDLDGIYQGKTYDTPLLSPAFTNKGIYIKQWREWPNAPKINLPGEIDSTMYFQKHNQWRHVIKQKFPSNQTILRSDKLKTTDSILDKCSGKFDRNIDFNNPSNCQPINIHLKEGFNNAKSKKIKEPFKESDWKNWDNDGVQPWEVLPSFPQYTHKSSLVSKRPSHSTACDQDTPWVNPQGNRECCPFPWNVDSNNT